MMQESYQQICYTMAELKDDILRHSNMENTPIIPGMIWNELNVPQTSILITLLGDTKANLIPDESFKSRDVKSSRELWLQEQF